MQDCAAVLNLLRGKGHAQNTGLFMLLSILENIYWSCPWISCWIALHKDCRDSILVMVNRFLKMIHFIACKKAKNDPSVTYLFFQKVVSLHDVPKTIILKRDVEFISKF